MLIPNTSKNLCCKLIASLSNGARWGKGSHLRRSTPFQLFHTFRPPSYNPKIFMAKLAIRSSVTLSVDGIPRLRRADAQAALFDYLHCTRGLGFQDAEFISKNSPRFIGELISMVKREQDVSRALTKLFRYHPINEFEPFLESLGLSPAEFQSLLPRGTIYLNDDLVLLDNYHMLSNYGVPRIRIGRMFKEANEILRYELGVLDMKLKAYEQLGLTRSTVIKLVTSNPQLLVGEGNLAFRGVVGKLIELGFDSKWIGGFLSSKNSYNWNQILETLCFLCEVGYSDAQMRSLFIKDAELLLEGSGKQVYATVGALLKLGLGMNEVHALVLNNPQILSPKCNKNFRRALHFLLQIGMEIENIAEILCEHMKLFSSHRLKGPKTVLKNFNGDKYSLCETIKEDPSAFFKVALSSKVGNGGRSANNYVEKTEFLERIGYAENSDEMMKALKVFRGRGDQLQERFDCLVRAGLDFNMVSGMVKKAPTVLNQSAETLRKKIECLEKYLGYGVESIESFPSYLCYDMDRIRARVSMYAWVREKGAAKSNVSVSTLVACSEARFVKYFVNVHPQGPATWLKFKTS